MRGRVKPGIELRISCSDTMLNYQLSQKFKLLGNDELNHLTINLTMSISFFIFVHHLLGLPHNLVSYHWVINMGAKFSFNWPWLNQIKKHQVEIHVRGVLHSNSILDFKESLKFLAQFFAILLCYFCLHPHEHKVT